MASDGLITASFYQGERLAMKINIVSFSDTGLESYPDITSVLLNSLMTVSGESIAIPKSYKCVKDGLPAIASALKECDALFILTSLDKYHETKRDICQAFHFKVENNADIRMRLSSQPDADLLDVHSLMPVGALALPLSDGMFSSFVIRSKKQSIFFMPICRDRTFLVMKIHVFPYLEQFYNCKCTSFSDFETDYAGVVFRNAAADVDIKIAIANTGVLKYVKKHKICYDIICRYTDSVPYVHENDIRDFSDYTRMKAEGAAEFLEYPFGAALVEDNDSVSGDYRVYIAVVNETESAVKCVSSLPDETYDDFIHTVMCEFLIMMSQMISTSDSRRAYPDIEYAGDEEDPELRSVIKGWKPYLYALLVAAACGLTYYAAKLAESGTFFFGL